MAANVDEHEACRPNEEKNPELRSSDPVPVDITRKKDGGVLKVIFREGTGEDRPQTGDLVSIHYVGTLESDGTKLDSSYDRDKPLEFSLGREMVIQGWDVGVATMRRGELAKFVCKAEYAYGEAGKSPKIPSNATLVFEVELVDWKGEDVSVEKDRSIVKSIVTEGEGYRQPHDMTYCTIHLVGHCDDHMFQDEELSYTCGEVFDACVVPGVEQGTRHMKKNEKAKFVVHSKHAYGAEGSAKFDIPPNTDVEYEIVLKELVDPKESWHLDNTHKLDESELSKTLGNEFFKDRRYAAALVRYRRVVELISSEDTMKDAEEEQRVKLLLASRLNSALCRLSLSEHSAAVEACDEALKLDAHNEKALWRRGMANFHLHNYEEACTNFSEILVFNPANRKARSELVAAQAAIKERNEREKKTYKGMFDKFADEDTKKEMQEMKEDSTNGSEDANDVNDKKVMVHKSTLDGIEELPELEKVADSCVE